MGGIFGGGGGMSADQKAQIASSQKRTQTDLEEAGKAKQRAERGSSRAGSRGLLRGFLSRALQGRVGS